MAHIINEIGTMSRNEARTKILCCLKGIKSSPVIYDAEAVNARINNAAKIKKQLEQDIFVQNNKIEKSAEAKKQLEKGSQILK